MFTRSAGTVVRRGRASDARQLANVYRETWRATYIGIIPALPLQGALDRRDEAWWRNAIRKEPNLLVLDIGGTIAGYATCGMARCASPSTGEIYELYILPEYQGMGLGEYLFEGCRGTIDRMGLRHLIVWALVENDQARRFYSNCGGQALARSRERFGSALLSKVAYVW